jgi:hypothetical protein
MWPFCYHCYLAVQFKFKNNIFQVHSEVKIPTNNLLVRNNCLNAHYKFSSAFENEKHHSINDKQLLTNEVHKDVLLVIQAKNLQPIICLQ